MSLTFCVRYLAGLHIIVLNFRSEAQAYAYYTKTKKDNFKYGNKEIWLLAPDSSTYVQTSRKHGIVVYFPNTRDAYNWANSTPLTSVMEDNPHEVYFNRTMYETELNQVLGL
ncbi:hypothetical protein F5X96DRAFT_674658 [Biscogniauxia mediterranea]|nr:hypothetical protein F5X96DRAFT_674658 [Biscogniauxia mediterranea]